MGGPITYNVNNAVGGGNISGTIETDGTTGVLGSANILDWNLLLNDGTGTFTDKGPLSGNNSQLFFTSTTNLTATATQLLFDFSGPGGGVMFQNPTTGSGVNYWCLQVGTSVCVSGNFVGEGVFVSTTLNTAGFEGKQVIGTAGSSSVPEPSSLSLIGLGAGVMAARRVFARRRAVSADLA
jgi:hypothetical protein